MKKNKKNLKGIGGWLLFFIITLFLQPIFNVISSVSTQNGVNLTLLVVLLILSFVALYGAIMMCFKAQWGITLAKIYLWSMVIFNVIMIILAMILSGSAEEAGGILGGSIMSFVYPAIWLSYLKKSVRVKNTYNTK